MIRKLLEHTRAIHIFNVKFYYDVYTFYCIFLSLRLLAMIPAAFCIDTPVCSICLDVFHFFKFKFNNNKKLLLWKDQNANAQFCVCLMSWLELSLATGWRLNILDQITKWNLHASWWSLGSVSLTSAEIKTTESSPDILTECFGFRVKWNAIKLHNLRQRKNKAARSGTGLNCTYLSDVIIICA